MTATIHHLPRVAKPHPGLGAWPYRDLLDMEEPRAERATQMLGALIAGLVWLVGLAVWGLALMEIILR